MKELDLINRYGIQVTVVKVYPPYFWLNGLALPKKTAWQIGHAIRKLMGPNTEDQPVLGGIVEQDEKYVGEILREG